MRCIRCVPTAIGVDFGPTDQRSSGVSSEKKSMGNGYRIWAENVNNTGGGAFGFNANFTDRMKVSPHWSKAR